MVKLLNCCGEDDQLLFSIHFSGLLTQILNTQFQHLIICIQWSIMNQKKNESVN